MKWLSDIRDACAFLEEIAAGSSGERFAEDRLWHVVIHDLPVLHEEGVVLLEGTSGE